MSTEGAQSNFVSAFTGRPSRGQRPNAAGIKSIEDLVRS
jgi:hypothetical protein